MYAKVIELQNVDVWIVAFNAVLVIMSFEQVLNDNCILTYEAKVFRFQHFITDLFVSCLYFVHIFFLGSQILSELYPIHNKMYCISKAQKSKSILHKR